MAETKSFRIQVMETVAALMTAAFGLLAALAWNQAIAWAVQQFLSNSPGIGYFVYAILVTILAIVATILIGRSLAKMKAAAERK